jgi:hypothetical protein
LRASLSGMTGSLPSGLQMASNLQALVITENGKNGITGTIPPEYGSFRKLQYVVFDGLNGIQGALPSELGNWRELEFLTLRNVPNLSSTIPTEWGRMTNLQNLQIISANIQGTIPTELGKCTMLQGLVLVDTQMTGTMPAEVCSLRQVAMSKLETDCSKGPILCDSLCCTSCYET